MPVVGLTTILVPLTTVTDEAIHGVTVTVTPEPVAVALALMVAAVALVTAVITVLAGMPVPLTARPMSAEVKPADDEVRAALALVVAPSVTMRGPVVSADAKVTLTPVAVAVALALSVTLVPLLICLTVVPTGMPAPVTSLPRSAATKAALADVSVALALVVLPSVTERAPAAGAAVAHAATWNETPLLVESTLDAPAAVLKVFAVTVLSVMTVAAEPVAGLAVIATAAAELPVAVPTMAAMATARTAPMRTDRVAVVRTVMRWNLLRECVPPRPGWPDGLAIGASVSGLKPAHSRSPGERRDGAGRRRWVRKRPDRPAFSPRTPQKGGRSRGRDHPPFSRAPSSQPRSE